MPISAIVENQILEAIPGMRAFAISLSGDSDRADDCVEETLRIALSNTALLESSDNFATWLFARLRSAVKNDYRKQSGKVGTAGEMYTALDKLPYDQREVLILIDAAGFCHEDVANICNYTVATVEDLLNRARCKLAVDVWVDRQELSTTPPTKH